MKQDYADGSLEYNNKFLAGDLVKEGQDKKFFQINNKFTRHFRLDFKLRKLIISKSKEDLKNLHMYRFEDIIRVINMQKGGKEFALSVSDRTFFLETASFVHMEYW
jgi:hypothetical protein